jgi:elongator complex protein 1
LIASTVRRPNKHEVAFFEPNGLRHGEFTLPFETKEIRVSNLAWNVNSDILSVAVEDSSEDLDGKRRKSIQLWTSNNYHWYLKQTIFLGKTKHSFGMMWDTISPNQLHVVDQTGSYHLLQWSFTTDRYVLVLKEGDCKITIANCLLLPHVSTDPLLSWMMISPKLQSSMVTPLK